MRRPVAKLGTVAIFQAQHLVAHRLPAARLLPQLGGLDAGHEALHRTRCIHLFAHDVFDLCQHALADGHPRIQARAELADIARALHELVRNHLRVGRGLFGGGDGEAGQAHE